MPVYAVMAAAVICLAGFVICAFMRKKERRSARRQALIGGVALMAVILFLTFDSMAMETAARPAAEMAARLAAEMAAGPAAEESETIYVSGQVVYPGMEAVEPVPQAAFILAGDEGTGLEKTVLLPLTDYHFSEKRWEDGFEMDVTISDYGADYYELGDKIIESSSGEEEPAPDQWEEGLLAQAGLDTDAYRIDRLQWKGSVYEKDGIPCRDIRAMGRRMVADCTAVYGGEVNRNVFVQDTENRDVEQDPIPGVYGYAGEDAGIWGLQIWGLHRRTVMIAVILLTASAFAIVPARRICRRLAAPLFLAGAVLSLAFLVKAGTVYAGGRQAYDAVRKIAYGQAEDAGRKIAYGQAEDAVREVTYGQAEDESAPQTAPRGDIKEASLRALNPEYCFWLSIPGTGIEYPVVQHEDNRYYLNHDFNRKEQGAGSIFADCASVPLSADNTVLYGHNMKDGSMFAGLKKYREESFFRAHPFIRIYYRGQWQECPVYSCQIRHENDAGACRTDLMEEEWHTYLGDMKKASLYETGTVSRGNEKLLTLSTCLGKEKRLIVQALINRL